MTIKKIEVKRYNYLADLPSDFHKALAVYRSGWLYVEEMEILLKRHGLTITDAVPTNDEYYFIEDRIGDVGLMCISFRGHYSKWWVVRKCEQIIDKLFPVKYKVTYYAKD